MRSVAVPVAPIVEMRPQYNQYGITQGRVLPTESDDFHENLNAQSQLLPKPNGYEVTPVLSFHIPQRERVPGIAYGAQPPSSQLMPPCNCCCCSYEVVRVEQTNVAVVESCGKFQYFLHAGNYPIFTWTEQVVGTLSLRVQEIKTSIVTKTNDNVFVRLSVSVQYEPIRNLLFRVFYLMENPTRTMETFILDQLRKSLSDLSLDETFSNKQKISDDINYHLRPHFYELGYSIIQTLITDITPDASVTSAMNDINVYKRMRETCGNIGDGNKIVTIKAAEANAEKLYLQGVGIARQRKAITEGMKEDVSAFTQNVQGATSKDILDLVVLGQYFDTITDISQRCPNLVLLPHVSHHK